MLSDKELKVVSQYLKAGCVFMEKHTNELFTITVDHNKIYIRSNYGVHKVKELELKKNYAFKATCRDIGTGVDTTRVLRIKAYKEYKLDT